MTKSQLFDAVKRLDVRAVRGILDAKPALLDARDQQGRNALHLACFFDGNAARKMVDLLIDRGIDIETTSDGKDRCPPLFFAVARSRDTNLVKHLISRGASPRRAPGGGLFAAGWYDDVKNLKLLLDAGAEIDVVVGVTPFYAAWTWRKFAAAKYLARRGADVNFRSPQTGETAYEYGVRRKYDEAVLKWLRSYPTFARKYSIVRTKPSSS